MPRLKKAVNKTIFPVGEANFNEINKVVTIARNSHFTVIGLLKQ